MKIQWYPGHMTKARREMQQNMKLVDLVIEIIDARIPVSSRNPDIDELANGKLRLVILNKADLADPASNERWEAYFKEKGIASVLTDARNTANVRKISKKIEEVSREKVERDRKKGIQNRRIRAMVVGIPNVGKSTLINSFAGKSSAKTGNKPGVTKGTQWIRLNEQADLLDTPGMLWPKFEDETVGEHLALIGSINDEIVDQTELALVLIRSLEEIKSGFLSERCEYTAENTTIEILEAYGRSRGCLVRGGNVDPDRAAILLMTDYRSGKLGRYTLEQPEDKKF
ncbi:MAG: ribosome biogenesis GTPase YlqF [Lachnospiraceae bacterium]|nr:ribosome biogenesis GTPase YlqF [Lachnospiraceae bacterium]